MVQHHKRELIYIKSNHGLCHGPTGSRLASRARAPLPAFSQTPHLYLSPLVPICRWLKAMRGFVAKSALESKPSYSHGETGRSFDSERFEPWIPSLLRLRSHGSEGQSELSKLENGNLDPLLGDLRGLHSRRQRGFSDLASSGLD